MAEKMATTKPTTKNHTIREMFPIENQGFVVNDDMVRKNHAIKIQQPQQSSGPGEVASATQVAAMSSSSSSPSDGDVDQGKNSIHINSGSVSVSIPKRRRSSTNLMVTKLNELSIEERTKGIYELHGVADNIEEEAPEVLHKKLQEMTAVAHSFGETEATAAYRLAVEQNSNYVDTRIKLLCLRSDYYDVCKAASRMVSFFSFKRRIFGDALLTKDITLDDLSAGDKEALERGIWQLGLGKDRACRAITLSMSKHMTKYHLSTIVSLCS